MLSWPLWTSMQLRSAGMIQPGVLVQMDPAGWYNICASKQITSIGNANIIITKKGPIGCILSVLYRLNISPKRTYFQKAPGLFEAPKFSLKELRIKCNIH